MAENRVMGAFWLLLGIAICVGASSFPFGDLSDPGPGYLPFACGGLIAAIGAAMAFDFRASSRPKTEERRRFYPDSSAALNVALALTAMVLCTALMNVIGFTLSAFLLIVFLMRVVGNTKWKPALFYATAYSIGAFFLFDVLLKTHLPIGMIWSWL